MKNYRGKEVRLFDCSKEVNVGDTVYFRDNRPAEVVSFAPPHKASSTGKVYVRETGRQYSQAYYPQVFDCKYLEV